ncbi:MAG TPA: hypothetical protein DCE39_12320 [Planctomycetaceae bacterium]|nr:hypothetical protein [Planctomycetaceae bacterium]
MPMAANREFLDWDCPALPAAANWLADRYTRNDVFDLSESLLVLPGARAGRRLLELLVDHATENSLRLVSPTTLTVGTLPEQLYVSQKPFADDLVQRCAWVAALKQTPAKQLGDVTAHRPGDDDSRGWLDLADLLKRQHGELAGDGFDFLSRRRLRDCSMRFRRNAVAGKFSTASSSVTSTRWKTSCCGIDRPLGWWQSNRASARQHTISC